MDVKSGIWWARLDLNQQRFQCHGFTDRFLHHLDTDPDNGVPGRIRTFDLPIIIRGLKPSELPEQIGGIGWGRTSVFRASTGRSACWATIPYGGERRTRI